VRSPKTEIVLMLWLGCAAVVSTPVSAAAAGSARAGETHFEEFKAACIDTKNKLVAIERHAQGQGWGRGMINSIPTGGTTAGWSYTKDGRHFSVLAMIDWPMPWGDEGTKGKPFSSCVVSTTEGVDFSAVSRMRDFLKHSGCEENPAAPGSRVRWPMAGSGYKVVYSYRRDRDPEGARDHLSLERLGTALADRALSGPYVPAACAPP
jgi:hypothetical protein